MTDINRQMNYTLGRGRLYFDLFKSGTNTGQGERYLGNTPSFAPSNETENLDHYSSEQGIRQKDASVMLQIDQNGAFTCDDITSANIALFFLGELERQTVVASQQNISSFVDIKRGRYFQIGMSDGSPAGTNHVDNVVLGVAPSSAEIPTTGDINSLPDVTVITTLGNAEIDLRKGRVYIEDEAPDIADGDQLVVMFDIKSQSRGLIVGKNNTIYGALRFVSDNPVGDNNDYFYPKVSLSPDGDYELKGDEWQTIGFTFQGLKLGNKDIVYITTPDADVVDEVDPDLQRTVTVVADATTGTANSGSVNVTATVRDGYNNVVSGETVNFAVLGGTASSVTPTSGATDVSGTISAALSATAAEAVSVEATVTTAGGEFKGQSQTVTFS